MTIANMAIEAGARAGMVAPDEITLEYIKGRPLAPRGEEWAKAEEYWLSLASDPGAKYDKEVFIDAADIAPTVTWGTSPQDVAPITGVVPDPAEEEDPLRAAAMEQALEYMGLKAKQRMSEIPIDKVFIGSCTNSRIEDLRQVAAVVKGHKVASTVDAMIVPGSGLVKQQAEAEGLDKIFLKAGFDWREPGCSMCLGMNPDQLKPQERCASTSNRNFEGRQGKQGRTHLVSPAMAAAAAITGKFTDVREMVPELPAEIKAPSDWWNYGPPLPAAPAFSFPETDTDSTGEGSGGRPGLKKVQGIAAPLDIQNVDTDKIIPSVYLKTVKRSGLGVGCFAEIRYLEDGKTENPDFVLNQEPFRQAKILICGDNFGCGSSREHAPWAIKDLGIMCLVSTSFADIFFNNCFKNGMLPIVLPEKEVRHLMADAEAKQELEVDLEKQTILRANGETISFDVDPFRKHCLIHGLDDIGLTLSKEDQILKFEAHRSENYPWLDGLGYKGKTLPQEVPEVAR